jgi:hypothetical protein
LKACSNVSSLSSQPCLGRPAGPVTAAPACGRRGGRLARNRPASVANSRGHRAAAPLASPNPRPGGNKPARLNGAPRPAMARSWGVLCSVGHPGFVAFAAVAPMIPMTVPIFSAVTSMQFADSRSGSRGGFVGHGGHCSIGWHWRGRIALAADWRILPPSPGGGRGPFPRSPDRDRLSQKRLREMTDEWSSRANHISGSQKQCAGSVFSSTAVDIRMSVLFVSHSSKDDALATALEAWLRANGFTDIFADHHSIAGGDKWRDALRAASGSCRVVLCLITENCVLERSAAAGANPCAIPSTNAGGRQARRSLTCLKCLSLGTRYCYDAATSTKTRNMMKSIA